MEEKEGCVICHFSATIFGGFGYNELLLDRNGAAASDCGRAAGATNAQ